MTLSGVKKWAHGVLKTILKPVPKERIWEWAEKRLKIPGGGENVNLAGRPYRSDLAPYTRAVMDWFREPGKQSLVIRKSSATGFTMAMLIVICWHIVNKPLNVGYYIDSEKEARNISKSRLKRWILDNRLLEDLTEDLSNLTYFLKGMVVYLLGSFASGAYRNKQLGIAILDELDAHPQVGDKEGDSWDIVDGRLKRDPNSKKCGFSTPILETGQTERAYQAGTMELYFVPCPHCGTMQPLVWARVKFKGPEFEDDLPGIGGEVNLLKVKEHTYYECESVGACRIGDGDKYEMLLKGEWRATNPKAPPGVRSMHISDLYSNFVTWGDLAVEWLGAQTNMEKLKAFVNQRLGEPFRELSGTLKFQDVARLRLKGFKRGILPFRPVLLALLTDVQQQTMKWGVLAYSSKGDMAVIDWGEETGWDAIAELSGRSYPIANTEESYPVECGLIDEGDGNRMEEVRRFTMKFPHLFPVKGRGTMQLKDLISPSKSWLDGEEVLTYHVNDPVWKSELLFRRIKRDEKNKVFETGRLILPWDITEEFVNELLNERRETKMNKFGFPQQVWIKKGPNDFLDICKYGLALWAIMEPDLRQAGRLKGADEWAAF